MNFQYFKKWLREDHLFGTIVLMGTILVLGWFSFAAVVAAQSTEPEGGGDVVVTTGDATSEGVIENEVNTVDTSATNEGDSDDDTQTDEEEVVPSENTPSTNSEEAASATSTATSSPELSTLSTTTASTTSSAQVENTASIDASTGSSTAVASQGDASVESGNAVAGANVINVVNTNIFNSFGLLLLLNALFGSDTFDLRDFDINWGGNGSSTCSLSGCNGANYNFTGSSTASLFNDVLVRAMTGSNTASGSGDASVTTGDAYAGANLVNVANSNFVDSNYLLISLNNFGDFSGDIVLPGKNFFSQFFSRLAQGFSQIFTSNEATIDNSVSTEADTGGNSATSASSSAQVNTGNATSATNVINQANTNLFGGDSVYILLRVHGTWSGEIFGLPEGLSWAQTPEGIQIFSTGSGSSTPGSGSFVANNNAAISNNVRVMALTGENRVDAETGEALIETGDAQAGANIVNIANTNVVGRNWILAVFNIFGNWSGNFSFGRPDLWVGGQAESSEAEPDPGSEVTFKFTIANNGDSDMTNTTLTVSPDQPYLEFANGESVSSAVSIPLGVLEAGSVVEKMLTARISDALPTGQTPITINATVSGKEKDANKDDNTEELGILAQNGSSGGSNHNSPARAFLFVEKSVASSPIITASSTVDYEITIRNNGRSPAYNAVLHDSLSDAFGNVVHEQTWDLGTILPREEVKVAYSVNYSAGTAPGLYINTAYVSALDDRSRAREEGNANSEPARAVVTVSGGLVSTAVCEPYLVSYIQHDTQNDAAEVEKLQLFLKDRGEAPSLHVNGVFDESTITAVRSFQEKYRDEVLSPWGIGVATGNVYYTTQKKINELACGGKQTFGLNASQLDEMQSFKATIKRAQMNGETPVIPTSNVGLTDGKEVIVTEAEKQEPIAVVDTSQLAGAAAASSTNTGMLVRFRERVKSFFANVPRVQASDLFDWNQ